MSEKIKKSFGYMKRYPAPLFLLPLAYTIIDYSFMMNLLKPEQLANSSMVTILSDGGGRIVVFFLISEILRIIFVTGYLSIVLDVINDKKISVVSFKDYIVVPRMKRILFNELIVMPIMAAGIMLLILPGLFWATISIFSYYIVLDNMSLAHADAISESREISKGYRSRILVLILIYSFGQFISITLPVVSVLIEALFIAFFNIVIGLYYKEARYKHAA